MKALIMNRMHIFGKKKMGVDNEEVCVNIFRFTLLRGDYYGDG